MSIQVSCPSGHVLRVKDSLAGKTGYCPHCRAKVHVPMPDGFSEDDVMSLLGPPPPPLEEEVEEPEAEATARQDRPHVKRQDAEESGVALFWSSSRQRPKTCPNCHKRVSFSFSVCPSCGTPIPGATTGGGNSAPDRR